MNKLHKAKINKSPSGTACQQKCLRNIVLGIYFKLSIKYNDPCLIPTFFNNNLGLR